MIPTKNNVNLESVKENKLVQDKKMKLVVVSKGPDVTDGYEEGDRVFLDVNVQLRELKSDGVTYLVAKDHEIIDYTKK